MADLGADTEAARDLLAFISESPTPFHACATAAARLDARPDSHGSTSPTTGRMGRGSATTSCATAASSRGPFLSAAEPTTPFRIIGAHTDSPNLRVKPHPDVERAGAQLLAAEVYGGALFNSWLDRDLGLAGRVALRGGKLELVRIDRPIARIPQLAIHLDRDVNSKGLVLNAQQHLVPVWATGSAEPEAFRRFLACELGVDTDDVLFWDLMFHDVQPWRVDRPRRRRSSPRRGSTTSRSCWAAVHAIASMAATDVDTIRVIVLFDHEEIGSTTNRGAASPLLDTTLERITRGLGGDRRRVASCARRIDLPVGGHGARDPSELSRSPRARSLDRARRRTGGQDECVTALRHRRAIGRGVHRGVRPRRRARCSTTSTAVTCRAARRSGRSPPPRLGIATVDVGAPQLSMHSAREMMATGAAASYRAALTAFLN